MIDPKKKFHLFATNKYFCVAPWNLLYVQMDGSINVCTRGKSFGNANTHTIEEIVSNVKYQELKSQILNDEITDHCRRCINFDNKNPAGKYQGLRTNYNKLSKHSSIDYYDTTKFKLTAVDLHWSSVCDLKCVTCWAGQSSSIAKEQNIPVRHTPTKTADKIIDFISDNQDELREIYLSGGEPTLIKHNLRLLKKIKKSDDLLIRVNSNLQWDKDNNEILKEILKFPKVMFTCSVDGIGEKFNYARRGGNWQKFIDNFDFLQNQSNVDTRTNTVFFVLTAQELPEILDYFYKRNVYDHTINQCSMGQDHLRCRNLPDEIKSKVIKNLESCLVKYKDNLNTCGCIKNCLTELNNPKTDDYHDHFDKIDLLQGSNWRKLYPELV